MMLVVIALAMSVVLAATFLLTQQPSSAIARNMHNHARARQIAESGLTAALAYTRDSTTWRNDQTSDQWLPAHPEAGGHFQLRFQDAADNDLADDPADPVTITCVGHYQGVSHRVLAILTPKPTQQAYGIIVGKLLKMSGWARIDAYYARDGAYGGTNQGFDATIAVNTSAAAAEDDDAQEDQTEISGCALIQGDIHLGPDSESGPPVDIPYAAVTGATDTLAETLDLAVSTLPDNLPASAGSRTISIDTILDSNQTYHDLTIKNNATLTVDGNIAIHLTGSLSITNNSELMIPDGSSLTLFVAGDVDIDTDAAVNADTANPGKLRIVQYQPGGKVTFSNASEIAARVESAGDLLMSNAAQLYGSAQVAGALDMTNASRIHTDLSLGPSGTPILHTLWIEP